MTRQTSALALALVILLVAAVAPASAQTEVTGTIEGTVLGADGRPVADAVVMSARADGSYPKSAVTDAQGTFRIPFLPPGSYDVTIQAEGFVSQPLTGVVVTATRTARVRIQLATSPTIEEEVTVTASQPTIDLQTTDRGTTITPKQIDLLPLRREAVNELAEFVPGVTGGSAWGAASGQANNYQLDGVTVNATGFGGSFLIPNQDWIAEYQVKGLGTGAEYGNFQGGLINVVTKSGSNTFTGDARFYYEDSSWNAENINAYEAGAEPDNRWEVSANVSGPIIKDELYYFIGLSKSDLETRVVNLLDSTPGKIDYLATMPTREQTKGLAKFTWQATEKDIFNVYFGLDDVTGDYRDLDSFTQPIASTKQDSPANFWNASWQRIFNQNNFLEVSFTGYSGEDNRLPYNGDTPGIELLGYSGERFQNSPYTRYREPSTNGLKIDWDSYQSWGSVKHNLKVGGSYEIGKWREKRERNGNLTWRPEPDSVEEFDPGDPGTWGFISSDWGGLINLDAEMRSTALYVQDYMTITRRLMVAAGLRWGSWKGYLTPGFGGGGQFEAVSDNAFDPRLGIVFDILGDERFAANASWGLYHQNLFALMFDRTEGGDAFTNFEYWDWDRDELPDPKRSYTVAEREEYFSFFDDSPLGDEVGPVEGYKQPYVEQWVAGLEYQLTPDWKLGLTYIRREYEDNVALVDRNLKTNYTWYPNVTAFEPNGNVVKLPGVYVSNENIIGEYEEFGDIAPGFTEEEILALTYDQDLVLTTAEDARRVFDQVQLVARKGGGTWGLQASLVWTDIEGNWDSISGYSDTEGGEGAGGFVRPNEQINWYGRPSGWNEWELKLDWTGDIYWGFRGGAFFRYYSGEYRTPSYSIGTRRGYSYETEDGEFLSRFYLLGVSGQNVYLEQKGSDQFDAYMRLDLRLERPVPLGDRLQLLLSLDCYNVLNGDEVVSVKTDVNNEDPEIPTTLYGSPRLRQQPRSFLLMAGLAW